MDPNSVSCVKCQAITTNDGKTVWVCENCHTVNSPSVEEITQAQPEEIVAPQPAPAAPVATPTATPAIDVVTAQAALDAAVTQAAVTPVSAPTPTPPPPFSQTEPVTPVVPQAPAEDSA